MEDQDTHLSLNINTILNEVATAFAGKFHRDELLQKTLDLSQKLFHAEVCAIFLRKKGSPNVIECVAGSGYGKKLAEGRKCYDIDKEEKGLKEKSFTGHIAATGKSYNIRNRSHMNELAQGGLAWAKKHNDAIWGKDKEGNIMDEMRNIMAAPLKIGEQITGVIKIENKIGAESFSEEEFSSFKAVGFMISLALENARLHQQTSEQQNNIINVFSKVTDDIVGSFKQKDLFNTILLSAQKNFHAEAASLYIYDKNILKCVAGTGFSSHIIGNYYDITSLEDSRSLTVSVYRKQITIKIDSKSELKEYRHRKMYFGKIDTKQWGDTDGFRNLLAVPLVIKNECLGLIKLENKEPSVGDCFSDDDKFHLETIANLISLTIRNFKLQDDSTRQLRLASAKAAHRIINQILRYDYIEIKLEKLFDKMYQQKTLEHSDYDYLSELIETVSTTTENLKKMVKQFGQFAKPVELERTDLDFNNLIRKAAKFAQSTEQDSRIHYNLSDDIPELSIDKIRFSEAIQELIKNALQAVKEGCENQKTPEIWLHTKRDTGKIILQIQDNGPGLPQLEDGMNIFEPFVTLSTQGTGLGLPTVKEMVEAHGGVIKAQSIYNETREVKGSLFEIILPAYNNIN
ncbi:MAG: ATP-binding protein [Candidatus Electrothrix aestuarii]|uniref:histidine kinase n=1 Tax=Candidatus Electrothrix aestuarii TaxID=3062594 RepID=A0AAU8M1E2_9BACT|nr:ATP-binding protein [Candidatus Electrothrix aestuarii]